MINFTISFSDVISLFSVIIATASFTISYFLWKEDKPRIKLEYSLSEIIWAWVGKMYDILSIKVINNWKRPVTINKQVSLKLNTWNYKVILFDNFNYIWGNTPYQRLYEYSSLDIEINLETFKRNKENIDLDNVLWIVVGDTLWNKYFVKLKNVDKLKIKEYINKS